MKKIFTFFTALLAFLSSHSQTQNPVSWTAAYKSISATEGEIIISANIQKGWHIYSQDTTSAGPIPTSLIFDGSKNYQLIGKAIETGAHEIFDKAFGAKISSFSDKAELKQKIKIISKPGFAIPFKIEYMSCNDMMCLPPKTIDLSVKVQ
jgi:hypothetical protein